MHIFINQSPVYFQDVYFEATAGQRGRVLMCCKEQSVGVFGRRKLDARSQPGW